MMPDMTGAATSAVAAIVDGLRAAAAPERAQGQRAYLKSERRHHGASVSQIRAVVRDAVSALGGGPRACLDAESMWQITRGLWAPGREQHARQVFEECLAAVEVLERHVAVLTPSDLPRFEPYVRDAGTWALVDPIATHLAGEIAVRHAGTAVDDVLERWAGDDDFWIRRASLLAELRPLAAGQPFERFARHADAMLDEREFFVRKAIGWVLRDTARRRQDEVVAYALPRAARFSGVTWREVVRHLPEADVVRLTVARAAQGAVP
jgi:3-methyladenine DNA glycosylase AlkD